MREEEEMRAALINTQYHDHPLLMLAQTHIVFRVCGISLVFAFHLSCQLCVCVCVLVFVRVCVFFFYYTALLFAFLSP